MERDTYVIVGNINVNTSYRTLVNPQIINPKYVTVRSVIIKDSVIATDQSVIIRSSLIDNNILANCPALNLQGIQPNSTFKLSTTFRPGTQQTFTFYDIDGNLLTLTAEFIVCLEFS